MTDSLTLLIWLVKATALLMLATGLTVVLRRAPAGARYLVWLATLVALLLAPAMSAWSPLPLPILPSAAPPAAVATTPIAPSPTSATDVQGAPRPAAPASQQTRALGAVSTQPLSTWTMALIAWGCIAALLLAWLAVGAMSVRRILRNARTLTNDAWLGPLYETADRLDLDRVPRLVMSAGIEMPFACCIVTPTIVLPDSAEEWSDARRRVVLFHELAHIRRRDLLGHTVGRLVCAFYWFHPLVWSAAKQLRAESERACDDLVLTCGARASDYANHLLEIVTSVRRQGAPATALPMANRREFEGRMLAILDPAMRRHTPSRAQKLLLTVGLGTMALTIAAISPTRRAASLPTPQTVSHDTDRTSTPSVTVTRTPSIVTKSTSSVSTKVTNSVSTALSSSVSTGDGLKYQDAQGPDTALLGRVLRTDKDPSVRKAASWALHGRRDGVPLLIERLRVDVDADVRETAAWALAGHSGGATVAALLDALRGDQSADVRGTAAWALGHSRGVDVTALESALGDADADVRQKALWALGQHGLSAAPARVVALLKDSDSDVRLMAAWVLGQVLDKTTIPAIRDAFLVERNSEVQSAEIRALLFMGDRSQSVIDRAMSSEDPEMRSRGVRMIAGTGAGIWPWPWPWPDPRPEP